jgi:hypothetical protein
MPGLEGVELLIGHLRGIRRAAQEDERVGVELVGDVRVAGHQLRTP